MLDLTVPEHTAPTVVDVTDLLDIDPVGTQPDEVGRDPANDDGSGFDWGDAPVVGVCEACGREIHAGVTGHVCDGEWHDHRDGEGIREVGAA